MRIEPGRNEDQVRMEAHQIGEYARFKRRTERVAAVARPERRIEDITDARLGQRASARIKRHLVRGGEEQILVLPENVLRAVAVVHVEVDNGDALGVMLLARIEAGD